MSTANNLAVLITLSISGWLEFVHHFEIVVWSFPSCSASHLPVFFFSTSTNFIRFKSLFAIFLVCMSVCNNQNTKIKLFYEIPPQPTKKIRRIYNYMTYFQFSIVFSTAHFSPYLCHKNTNICQIHLHLHPSITSPAPMPLLPSPPRHPKSSRRSTTSHQSLSTTKRSTSRGEATIRCRTKLVHLLFCNT